MRVTLDRNNLELFKIDEDAINDFNHCANLSDFQVETICLVGELMRNPLCSSGAFCDGRYWYDFGHHTRCSVFMTSNGIICFKTEDREDDTNVELYRVSFHFEKQ